MSGTRAAAFRPQSRKGSGLNRVSPNRGSRSASGRSNDARLLGVSGRFQQLGEPLRALDALPNHLEDMIGVETVFDPFVVRPSRGDQSSSTFDQCRSEKSVEIRYKKVLEERGANPLMLHLARAFAVVALKVAQAESIQHFIEEVDLVEEFQWPASLEDLRKRASEGAGPTN